MSEGESANGPDIILFVVLVLGIGSLIRHVSRNIKIPIPYTAIIFVVGMILGALVRAHNESVVAASASLIA
jgi:hypothetical protein